MTVSLEVLKRLVGSRKRDQLGVVLALEPRGMVPVQAKVTVRLSAVPPRVPRSQVSCDIRHRNR